MFDLHSWCRDAGADRLRSSGGDWMSVARLIRRANEWVARRRERRPVRFSSNGGFDDPATSRAATGALGLISHAFEDQHPPPFAMERELFPRDLEPLDGRQQVLEPLFLPEERLGWTAPLRSISARPTRQLSAVAELGAGVARRRCKGRVGIAQGNQPPLGAGQRIPVAAAGN